MIDTGSLNFSRKIIDRLIDGLPYAFMVADAGGNVLVSNGAFQAMPGCCAESVAGKKTGDFGFPALREFLSDRDSFETVESEIRFNSAEGVRKFYHCRRSVVFSDDGGVRYRVFTATDISVWKEKERIAAKNESRIQSIFQNINEYIYSVEYENESPFKTYHSPRCYDITGYSPLEFEADPSLWYRMIYDEDRPRVFEFLDSIGTEHQSSYIEHRIVHKRGWVRWVSNTCTLHRDRNGKIQRLDGYILDITSQKELLEQMKKLTIAVEQSPASVVITDAEGVIEYVNPKFTEVTGYSLFEIAGKNPRVLKSGEMTPDVYRTMWETIKSGKEWRGEFLNRKKNGDLYWESASISPLRGSSGDIVRFIAVKEDISQRKKTEEALRVRNQMMEEDLRYAQSVQLALLPTEPPPSDIAEIVFRYKPLEKVGGDCFSFFPTDKGIGIFVGDVSGHGVPAALFLSLIRFASEQSARDYAEQPGEFLRNLNESLTRYLMNYFMTAAYGFFSRTPEGVTFSFANGAHPGCVVQRKNGETVIVKPKGKILGSFKNLFYEEVRMTLEKGDRVFYYTDGIPETRNAANEIIGYDETASLADSSRRDSLAESCDVILSKVDEFRGDAPVDDDIVLIGCEIK
jgi:sigma-B regulation protein RsbU (phosphoserine phosphatase)